MTDSRDRVTISPQCYCNHIAYSNWSEYILYEAALFCHSSSLLIICISVYLCQWTSVLFVWKLYIWRRKVLRFCCAWSPPRDSAADLCQNDAFPHDSCAFYSSVTLSWRSFLAEANWAVSGSYMVNNIHNKTTVTTHSSNFPSWQLFPLSQFVTTLLLNH